MDKRKLEYISLDDLHAYERNTRTHSEEQIEQLKKSITEFGFTNPILIDEDNVIIAGHGRSVAARELGMKEVPCLRLTGLSEVQRKALRIADNQLALNAGWDEDLLRMELEDIRLEDFNLDVIGFSLDEVERLLNEPEEEKVVEEDNAPEIAPERCHRGDIWQLGNHRLMCGDSTDTQSVAMLMGLEKADLVFTDPPYNVAIGTKNEMLNKFQKSGRCTIDIKGDKGMSDDECRDKLWKPAFTNMKTHAKDHCAIYITMPQGGTHMMMMMAAAAASWQVKHELIWLKSSPTFSMGRLDYDYKHEPICYGWNRSHRFFGKGAQTKSVWEFPKPNKCDKHPTMKPVELVVNAIMNSSLNGEIVLDLFGGSGTTLVACEQTHRACRMMELDEHYCDVIIQRWENLTGQKAVKL